MFTQLSGDRPMNQRIITASALASLMALGLASNVVAQDKAAKEKCYGIAKAGQNLSGSHSCAGQSKVDNGAEEWKYVAKGTCGDMKGMTADDAKKKSMMGK
jgi:uncharacterized membrane protein